MATLRHSLYPLTIAMLLSAASSTAQQVLVVEMPIRAWIYDSKRQRIFATTRANAGQNANSVVTIDPKTGKVEKAVFVGADPGAVALSSESKYLYIALGEGSVRKFDLTTQTSAGQFSIGEGLGLTGMAGLPGDPESVVIMRERKGVSPNDEGVMVYKSGRPVGGRVPVGHSLVEGLVPGRFYGYENQISTWDFTTVQAEAEGIRGISRNGSFIRHNTSLTASANGLVLVGLSNVVDPEARQKVGTLPLEKNEGTVYLDAQTGRAFQVNEGGGGFVFSSYSLANFGLIERVPISGTGAKGGPSQLGRIDNGLAFVAGDHLILLRGVFGPALRPVDLSVKRSPIPNTLPAGKSLTYTLTITNNGSATATNVMLSDLVVGSWKVLDLKTTAGSVNTSDNIVKAELGNMNPGASATVTVSLNGSFDDGPLLSAVVRAYEPDSNPSNNYSLYAASGATVDAPDLTVELQGIRQMSVGVGANIRATITGTVSVRNLGKKASEPCILRLYLSDTPRFLVQFSTLLLEVPVSTIQAGQALSSPIRLPLGAIGEVTGLYIVAVVDPDKRTTDKERGNNQAQSRVP